MDVNEIFRDLGTMIHEQGEMIGKKFTFSSTLKVVQISARNTKVYKIGKF